MDSMFAGCISFDQNIGNWDIGNVTQMSGMFSGAGLSIPNYDSLLIGWESQGSLQTGVPFDGGNSQYCNALDARVSLIDNHTWTIMDGGYGGCDTTHFVTTWKTDNPGSSNNTSITIPCSFGDSYNYDVDWNNDGYFDEFGITGTITHDFGSVGTYTIRIRGDFPHIFFDDSGDKDKILSVDQWGNIVWSSMYYAFSGCQNLQIPAVDAPDLSSVTDMSHMFYKACDLNSDIGAWDVSNVTNMSGMFSGAASFNQNLNAWDVSSVTDMSSMFAEIPDPNMLTGGENQKSPPTCGLYGGFAIDVSNWDVSNVTNMSEMFLSYGYGPVPDGVSNWNVGNVTDMSSMFEYCQSFDQDIGNWDVSNVTNMRRMFYENTDFNQDIGGWNVGNVTDMSSMFEYCESFNKDIGAWDVSNVNTMDAMFLGGGLSTVNYDNTLIGWAALPTLQDNVLFDAGSSMYCMGKVARDILTDVYTWIIADSGFGDCGEPFVTTWLTTSSNEQITIPTIDSGYFYFVDWGDGIMDSNLVENAVHSYPNPGLHTVSIIGSFPRIYFNNSSDTGKVVSIEQWGDVQWRSMAAAFYGCSDLKINAVDTPDLGHVTDMSLMFAGCLSLNTDLGFWDVSNVTHMDSMLAGCKLSSINYDKLLIGWNALSGVMDSVTFDAGLSDYCDGASARAQLIADHHWSISDGGEDCEARKFITTWYTGNTWTDGFEESSDSLSVVLPILFSSTYCVDWGDGNVECGYPFSHTYAAVDTYSVSIWGEGVVGFSFEFYVGSNKDFLKLLTVEQWGEVEWQQLDWAFANCENLTFNAPDIPDMSAVSDLSYMFLNCSQFNQDIGNWDVSNVTNMSHMFQNCASYNQSMRNWDVSNVIDMSMMFWNASNFDQNIGDWDVGNVHSMQDMFQGGGMSTMNYDSLLIVWASLPQLQNNVPFNAGNSNYCEGADARQSIISSYTWMIDDGEYNCNDISFISVWKTDNPGESNDYEIHIPTFGDGYNYNIDWGDDSVNTNVLGDITHEYDTAGTYTVKIWGDFPRIYFNNSGDREKILLIEHWGTINWSSMENAFYGCTNLSLSALDIPDLLNVSSLRQMFREDTSFNSFIGYWNVMNVSDMSGMFYGCSSFNQDIGSWNIRNVTTMDSMLIGCNLSTYNYDNIVIGWQGLDEIPNGVVLDAGTSQYCLGEVARSNLITNKYWEISDGGKRCSGNFITTWYTGNPGNTDSMSIMIPTTGEGYDYRVEWGDGLQDSHVTGSITHSYDDVGIYTVTISGGFPRISLGGYYEAAKLLTIEQWGDEIGWQSMNYAFGGCENLIINAVDNPDISMVSDMFATFYACTSLINGVSGWDVGNVTNMSYMFGDATQFNEDLGEWNVGSVTDMSYMLYDCYNFNQDIGNWNVSNATNMQGMFLYCPKFNQNLADWDVSNVTNMTVMFDSAVAFDQNLGDWNISSVTTMALMFAEAGMSTSNYDSSLIGWANLMNTPTGIPFNGGSSQYCAVDAWNALDTLYNWAITDGGMSPYCCTDTTTFAGGAWSNGAPNTNTVAIFNDDYDSDLDGGSLNVCRAIINETRTVIIRNGDFLDAANTIDNFGVLQVDTGGSATMHGELYK